MQYASGIARGLRPAEKLDVATWARESIVLSPRQATGFPGPYRVELTPYLRGIFEALQDKYITSVAVCKCAQAGLTLAAHVWICYVMAEDPGPVLIVMPSEQLASSASENRLQPMIQDSARMRLEMPSDPDRFKKLEYQMRGCTLNWVGSNSPSNLASRPVRYLMLDEVDKYPDADGKEASAIALAMQRTKTFWNRKALMMSTPTIEMGNIWQQYLRGDQRKFYAPCHKCGTFQSLKWSQVKFDATKTPEEAAGSACYECESCGEKWSDNQRKDALQRGEWRATAQSKESGHASFHLSSLYVPWVTLRGLVSAFMQAKDHPNLLHDFINSELGEPWKPDVVALGDEVLAERMMPYTRGQLFAKASCFADKYKDAKSIIVIGVDVQKDYLRYVVRQFVAGGDSGLIDYGTLHAWQEVADMADALGAHGADLWVMVDSGYGERTQEVYEACVKHRFIPTKGSSTPMRSQQWAQSTINIFEGTRKQSEGESVQLITFDTITTKLQLFDRIQGRGPFGWYLFSGVEDAYVKEVTSEEYDQSTNKFEKKRGRRDNHFLDCEVLCLVAAIIAGFNSRVFNS
jgi:phage terminase large subunit GpA-like protein